MTCKNCENWFYCLENSREYPCRDFKFSDKATTKPNKRGKRNKPINNPPKNKALNRALQKLTGGINETVSE